MCLLAAHAQEPDGDAPAETSADPPPVSDAPVIDMQRYCNRYDVRNRSRYYPNEALRNRVSGQVVLDCVLNDDDTTRSCQVVSEEPQHRGFATASLVMVCRWPVTEARLRQMQVYERDGERRYRRTVEWRTE
ncbi:MAG TPA: energy transducer TonB [Vitreimonas sp.]|jgi:hypothetical protein|nr:energy transducer TonB [Vitreimonas sp.]